MSYTLLAANLLAAVAGVMYALASKQTTRSRTFALEAASAATHIVVGMLLGAVGYSVLSAKTLVVAGISLKWPGRAALTVCVTVASLVIILATDPGYALVPALVCLAGNVVALSGEDLRWYKVATMAQCAAWVVYDVTLALWVNVATSVVACVLAAWSLHDMSVRRSAAKS